MDWAAPSFCMAMAAAFHAELDRVSAADRLALIREAEQALLKKDPRIAAAGRDMISVTSVETRIENSCGLKLSHRDNAAVAFLSALAKEGDRESFLVVDLSDRNIISLSFFHCLMNCARKSIIIISDVTRWRCLKRI